MSAYKDALHITSDESGSRLALAQDLLGTGQGVVVLDGFLALRPTPEGLLAEVISDGASRDPAALVGAARSLLDQATLVLHVQPYAFLVVDDYGTGTSEIWRAV
jgi:hypothetical protein